MEESIELPGHGSDCRNRASNDGRMGGHRTDSSPGGDRAR